MFLQNNHHQSVIRQPLLLVSFSPQNPHFYIINSILHASVQGLFLLVAFNYLANFLYTSQIRKIICYFSFSLTHLTKYDITHFYPGSCKLQYVISFLGYVTFHYSYTLQLFFLFHL